MIEYFETSRTVTVSTTQNAKQSTQSLEECGRASTAHKELAALAGAWRETWAAPVPSKHGGELLETMRDQEPPGGTKHPPNRRAWRRMTSDNLHHLELYRLCLARARYAVELAAGAGSKLASPESAILGLTFVMI